MRILVVENGQSAAEDLAIPLLARGYNVETADCAEEGLSLGKRYDFDIILTNAKLGDGTGLGLLRNLRMAKIKTPVMMLSATDDLSARVSAFGSGADDFLVTPYHPEELIARLEAIVRRTLGHADSVIEFGALAVCVTTKEARVNDEKLHLTPQEYQILEILAQRRGRTMTKEAILDRLGNGLDEPELKIIDVYICKLRKKLKAAGIPPIIETVRSSGYVIKDGTEKKQPVASARKAAPAISRPVYA